MRCFSEEYWTLTQAAAWVVFRSDKVVAKFAPPDPNSWPAFMAYPTMREEHPETGKVQDLFKALRAGSVTAWGRRMTPGTKVEAIESIEWFDLVEDLNAPYRHTLAGGKDIPWENIRLKREDVEKHWRRTSEILGRSRFPKEWFQQKYVELRNNNDDLSQNELIEDLREAYSDQFNKEAPSRSSVQRYIKSL